MMPARARRAKDAEHAEERPRRSPAISARSWREITRQLAVELI